MRTQALTLLSGGVLLLGVTLGACSASSGDTTGTAGAFAAGAGSVAGSSGAAAAGAPGAGAPSVGGDVGVAGASGSPAQAGSAGAVSGTAGTVGTAGSGGAAVAGAGGAVASGGAAGGGAAGGGTVGPIPDVKFVAYIDDWSGSYATQASKLDFSKVTHVNLAFALATTGNDWKWTDNQSDANVKVLVDKAHAAGAKVLASLGGGGGDTTVATQYKTPSNDDMLVSNLDAFLKRLNLDGADIDIEKENKADVGDNYGTFVQKVVDKLHPEGKLVTAAVASYLAPAMNDSTLKLFDFVNIMVYSNGTGAYTSELNFYTGKGMKKTQLTLGILSENDSGSSNTANTQAITNLSKSWGGAMLWDVAEDSSGQYKVIQSAF